MVARCADSSFYFSAYGVLAVISRCCSPPKGRFLGVIVRHWKHHFPSDLHVLSMPPAFILNQDRTLHEIHSCITYSFLIRRQSGFGIEKKIVLGLVLHLNDRKRD
ncbi:hypothetical protein Hanom_Chr09g00824681 [Helianthus anomalus]